MSHIVSAGLLMYRIQNLHLEVFIAHPGGPYFRNKDWGIWSIPKGVVEPDEELMDAATREFMEETGLVLNGEEYIPLGYVVQRGGKTVYCWAFEGNVEDTTPIYSNTFSLEWPPNSGIVKVYPETDKAMFFNSEMAKKKMNPAQADFVDRLHAILKVKRKI